MNCWHREKKEASPKKKRNTNAKVPTLNSQGSNIIVLNKFIMNSLGASYIFSKHHPGLLENFVQHKSSYSTTLANKSSLYYQTRYAWQCMVFNIKFHCDCLKPTRQAKNTRTRCSIKYLIMYLHVIAFKQLVLECACKAIKPITQKIK